MESDTDMNCKLNGPYCSNLDVREVIRRQSAKAPKGAPGFTTYYCAECRKFQCGMFRFPPKQKLTNASVCATVPNTMSKKHEIIISDEVLEVLGNSAITPHSFTLPAALERGLYNRVAKPLGLLGIKWSRQKGHHVFDDGAYDRLQIILSGGSVIDTKKALQQYFTPASLAYVAARNLASGGNLSGAAVLEPSAGHGALALAARDMGGNVTCVEIDSDCGKKLRELNFRMLCGDFLKMADAMAAYEKFDFVLMNPPFTAGQDVKHVMAAHAQLKRYGRLVAIVSPAFQFRETALHSEFKDFFEQNGGKIIQEIPAGTFSESGAEIRTVLIQIDK